MTTVPKKVQNRIIQAARKYQSIVEEARNRDINEADTVTIVKAMLADMLGWDPFFEVTAEFSVRGRYVDLAVRRDDSLLFLIEVKAIGSDLKDHHLRQVVQYGATQGMEWVVLTNGAIWQGHKVIFGKPLDHELVFEFDLTNCDPDDPHLVEHAFLLSKEGMRRSAIREFHEERLAMSKFNIAAILPFTRRPDSSSQGTPTGLSEAQTRRGNTPPDCRR